MTHLSQDLAGVAVVVILAIALFAAYQRFVVSPGHSHTSLPAEHTTH